VQRLEPSSGILPFPVSQLQPSGLSARPRNVFSPTSFAAVFFLPFHIHFPMKLTNDFLSSRAGADDLLKTGLSLLFFSRHVGNLFAAPSSLARVSSQPRLILDFYWMSRSPLFASSLNEPFFLSLILAQLVPLAKKNRCSFHQLLQRRVLTQISFIPLFLLDFLNVSFFFPFRTCSLFPLLRKAIPPRETYISEPWPSLPAPLT